MAEGELKGRRVAILATTGVEDIELIEPRRALDMAGAETVIVSPEREKIRSWRYTEWGDDFAVDTPIEDANPNDFDALYIPGGVMSPDKLRTDERSVDFVRGFADEGKPIASICHGPWMLAEADLLRGKRVTSWPSLETDLRNAGAEWVDQEVVQDGEIVTSRDPDDLPAFNRAIVQLFAGGEAEHRRAA